MSNKLRTKFAYLSYDEMMHRIYKEELNAYDFCWTHDTKEWYVISPELKPVSVISRVSVFDSVKEAEEKLNVEKSTYKGQFVAILEGGKYTGYIVNKVEGIFKVSPLHRNNNQIDYNTLSNAPIINYTGVLEDTVIASELATGVYKLKGQYKIAKNSETTYLSASGDLIIVHREDTSLKIKVKRISIDTIVDYEVENGSIISTNSYATEEYVDKKIDGFETSIKLDVEAYVEQTVEDVLKTKVDQIIEERFEHKLSELIIGTTNEEVKDLFK